MRYFSTCGINSKNSNTALAHYLIPAAPDQPGPNRSNSAQRLAAGLHC